MWSGRTLMIAYDGYAGVVTSGEAHGHSNRRIVNAKLNVL